MQSFDSGTRSGRFTRDQAGDSLWRSSSVTTAEAPPGGGTEGFGAAPFEVQAFSGIQDVQQETGEAVHASEQLMKKCFKT